MTSAAPRIEEPSLARRLAAEALGTALLLATVVGSGIMAERLTHDFALALLCNTLATGAMLFVLILLFADVSGAHFNPAVTLVRLLSARFRPGVAAAYGLAQIAGADCRRLAGPCDVRRGAVRLRRQGTQRLWPGSLSEGVATFGLILTIAGAARRARETVAAAVGLYILAAYWFTASTSFANPAVTLARALTPSFAGIRPADAPAFIAAQFAGALLAWIVARFLFPSSTRKRNDCRQLPAAGGAFAARDVRRRQVFAQIDAAIRFFDLKPVKPFAETRSADARPRRQLETGPMSRAEKEFLVLGEEVVGEGLQRDELVRAAIHKSVPRPFRLYNDDIELVLALAQYHVASSRIG